MILTRHYNNEITAEEVEMYLIDDFIPEQELKAERELEELPSDAEVMRKQHGLTREQLGVK